MAQMAVATCSGGSGGVEQRRKVRAGAGVDAGVGVGVVERCYSPVQRAGAGSPVSTK